MVREKQALLADYASALASLHRLPIPFGAPAACDLLRDAEEAVVHHISRRRLAAQRPHVGTDPKVLGIHPGPDSMRSASAWRALTLLSLTVHVLVRDPRRPRCSRPT
jgi:hypothetical protein